MNKIFCFSVLFLWMVAVVVPGADLTVTDGGMTGPVATATGLPQRWQLKLYDGRETVGDAHYDVSDGQKSIVLKWQSGAKGFGIEPDLVGQARPGDGYELSGWVRTAPEGAAQFAVESFDAQDKSRGEQLSPLFTAPAGRRCAFKFRIPDATAKVRIYLLSSGAGAVRFADVRLQRAAVSATAAAAIPFSAHPRPALANAVHYGREVFNLIADFPMPLAFELKGDSGKLRNPTLVVELPPQVKIVSAFSNHPGAYREEKPEITTVKRSGDGNRDWIRYRFVRARTFDILLPVFRSERKLTLVLETANGAQPGRRETLFWHLENDGIRGAEQKIELNILPALTDQPLPAKFSINRWNSIDYLYPTDDVLNRALTNLTRAGAASATRAWGNSVRNAGHDALLRQHGFQICDATLGDPLQLWRWSAAELKQLGDYRQAVLENGRGNGKFCPEYFTDDPKLVPLLKRKLANTVKGLRPGDRILLDAEPWETMSWCFCDYCREKFAREVQLPKVPSAAEIKKQHESEWIRFRCANTTRQIAAQCAIFRELVPGIVIGDYNYILDFDAPERMLRRVAKDSRLLDAIVDEQLPSYYHTTGVQAFRAMQSGSRQLKKPYMPFCAIDGLGYLARNEVLTPAEIRLFTLAAAVNGCPGIWIYPGIHIDGGFWRAFHQAVGEIAKIEPYCANYREDADTVTITPRFYRVRRFRSGGKPREVGLPKWADLAATAAYPAGAGRTFAAVFNYSASEVLFVDLRARVPAGSYGLENILTGKLLAKALTPANLAHGVLLKVPVTDALFVLLRPMAPGDTAALPPVTPEALEREFEHTKSGYGKVGAAFAPIDRGGWRLRGDGLGDDGAPLLSIVGKQTELQVNRADGVIRKWRAGATAWTNPVARESIFLPAEQRGTGLNAATRWRAEIQPDGDATLTASAALSGDLSMEKQFRLRADGKLTVRWELKNTGAAPLPPTALKVQNHVDSGKARLSLENRGAATPLPSGVREQAFPTAPGKHGGLPAAIMQEVVSGTSGAMEDGETTLTFAATAPRPEVYYTWRNEHQATLEWIFPPVTLMPGATWSGTVSYQLAATAR